MSSQFGRGFIAALQLSVQRGAGIEDTGIPGVEGFCAQPAVFEKRSFSSLLLCDVKVTGVASSYWRSVQNTFARNTAGGIAKKHGCHLVCINAPFRDMQGQDSAVLFDNPEFPAAHGCAPGTSSRRIRCGGMSCKRDPDSKNQACCSLSIFITACLNSDKIQMLYTGLYVKIRTIWRNKTYRMFFNSSHLKSQIIQVMTKIAFTVLSRKKEREGNLTYIICQKKEKLGIRLFRNNFHKTFPVSLQPSLLSIRKKRIPAIFT